jgi:hypothetical protein
MSKTKCFFCDEEAMYYDVVIQHEEYIIADVCPKHFTISLVS